MERFVGGSIVSVDVLQLLLQVFFLSAFADAPAAAGATARLCVD